MAAVLIWIRRILGEGISTASLGFFCDQCAVLIGAGMPFGQAIERASQVGDPEIVQIGRALSPVLAAGMPISEAFERFSGRLPPIFLPLLKVGEASGTLQAAFQRLANSFRRDAGFEYRYQYEVFNPWLVIFAIAFYSIWNPSQEGGVVGMAQTAATTLLKLAVFFILGRWIARLLARWHPFRMAVDTIKLAIPVMGVVARNLAAARWSRSLATLYNAGVPVSQALEIASMSALNAHYERALQHAAQRTRRGQSLSESLAGTELFPERLISVIAVGEGSGHLGDAIDHFASILEAEAIAVANRSFMAITVAVQIVATFAALGAVSY